MTRVNNARSMDRKLIAEGLKKPGKSKKGLADALGRSPSAITAILRGERQIKAQEISIIAKYLELNVNGGGDLIPVKIEPIIKTSPAHPAPLEAIKDAFERISELEQRMDAVEDLLRAIGSLQPKKR